MKPTYNPKKLDLELFSEESKSIVKEYMCFICKGVLFHPIWNDSCQHIFCKDCLASLISEAKVLKCPQCLSEDLNTILDISCMTKPVNVLISLIEKQIISCKNLCGWRSSVKELKSHLTNCAKQTAKCINPGCDIEFTQDEKSTHDLICEFKITECVICAEKILKKSSISHYEQCLMRNLDCPNCGEAMQKKELDTHLKSSCGNILTSCTFELVGCLEKFMKKNECDHLVNFTDRHNQLFMKFLVDSKNTIDSKISFYDSTLVEIREKLSLLENQNQILNEVEEKSNVEKKFLNRKQNRGKNVNNSSQIEDSEKQKDCMISSTISKEVLEKTQKEVLPGSPTANLELIKKESFYATNGIKIKKQNNFLHVIDLNNSTQNHPYEFLLIDKKLNVKEKIFKCSIETKNENWFAVGICIKELLVKNELKIKNNFLKADHGFFGICNEGILYHNNSSYKNNSKIQNFPKLNLQNYILKFEYEYEKKILKISINEDFLVKIDMVFPIQPNMTLMPCLIFKSKIEEMKIYLE